MTDIINVESQAVGIRTAETIATEINTIKRQTQKIMLASSIEIGKRLTEAKELVDHGQWSQWLQKNVNYSERTAQNLMRVYDQYGEKFGMTEMDSLFASGAPNVFEELSYTQALALLSLPTEEEREQFVEENDVANMSTREMQDAIKAKVDAEARANDAEARASDAERMVVQEQQRADLAEKNLENVKAQLRNADEQKTDILEQARKEREALAARVKELEARPMVSEDKTEEIDKLKQKIKELEDNGPDQDKLVFQGHLVVLENEFNAMLNDIENIDDGDKRQKFVDAARKMLNRLQQYV
ncbi:DUF3102 domain-containing protein [Megasphaera hexanoica]|uniref:DUF3102 domain-containing protein n=1 Tax=Megasphaera hexanoica TaxID=1675036 RepID=A0ABW7DPQ3_9FIRM|nr:MULTISPECIES: DUF3102 domain-containing protein [Megasphaera]AXB82809.1 hypothetical protein ACT01_11495 [Megasphaera hexanoica]KUH55877.1 hypothetical protein AT798_04680 [Megasphaera sp. DJF_B143]